MLGVATHPQPKETAVLHTLSRPAGPGQSPGSGADLLAWNPAALPACPPPDPEQLAASVSRCLRLGALRGFRARLYECLTARPDALFELADAILCADHAVTSLAQLSLVPEFRRGHGALYDALAGGQIDQDKLAGLLTRRLPALVDGGEGRAWVAEHDRIDYELLEAALAGV